MPGSTAARCSTSSTEAPSPHLRRLPPPPPTKAPPLHLRRSPRHPPPADGCCRFRSLARRVRTLWRRLDDADWGVRRSTATLPGTGVRWQMGRDGGALHHLPVVSGGVGQVHICRPDRTRRWVESLPLRSRESHCENGSEGVGM